MRTNQSIKEDADKMFELKDCDLCKQKYYPKGKCPFIKWNDCKIRLEENQKIKQNN